MSLTEQFEEDIRSAQTLDQLSEPLQLLLSGHYGLKDDDRVVFTRALVERFNGIRVEIRHREHAPPHFHVLGDNIDASFRIDDGTLLAGGLPQTQLRAVRWWYGRSRTKLKEVWNRTRPTDCPVGPIE